MRPVASRKHTDAMDYLDNMEMLDSGIMDTVLGETSAYDPGSFSERDVMDALEGECGIDGFAALLSPAAEPHLEEMAERARDETRRHFGNSVCLFTPLYVSNYCSNECVYCGFNCRNRINRAALDLEGVERELDAIAATGLKEVLILTGESRARSDVGYIGECVRLASERFSTVGIEVYPMNSDEYAHIHDCGADYVTVFQETYDPIRYEQLHLAGPKRIFSYRFDAQERALRGGMRGVAFGTLLGLRDDFRKDAFACGLHAMEIQRHYPHAETSMSLPRLRPAGGVDNHVAVTEAQLLQVSLAYRIFLDIRRSQCWYRRAQRRGSRRRPVRHLGPEGPGRDNRGASPQGAPASDDGLRENMIVITSRNLCARPFLEQVGLLAAAHPEMIILREKDLSDDELLSLAAQCLEICERHNVPLAINSNMEVARELNICRIHLPMQLMKETEDFGDFSLVGASVHSVEQAKEAEDLGADYVLAGHVYHTACKDSDPRGVPFLEAICDAVDIPVYGVGGITPDNYPEVMRCGAAGAAVMSSAMTEQEPSELVQRLSRRIE